MSYRERTTFFQRLHWSRNVHLRPSVFIGSEKKIADLLGNADIDKSRIITETAIFADHIAVSEETVRLRSHIAHLKDLFNEGGVIGKKIDFIVQEMNRETNTIGSKCQDIEISKTVVDMKSEIEKIREQIQNIE